MFKEFSGMAATMLPAKNSEIMEMNAKEKNDFKITLLFLLLVVLNAPHCYPQTFLVFMGMSF